MKPKHYAIGVVAVIILMVSIMFFWPRKEKQIPDSGWRVKEDSVYPTFDSAYYKSDSGIRFIFPSDDKSSATQQLLIRDTIPSIYFMIMAANGDMAMRDSLGNWQVRGNINIVLEQFYKSLLLEQDKVPTWKSTNKKKDTIPISLWIGRNNTQNFFLLDDSGGLMIKKYPYKTETFLTDPPSYADYYKDRNGKDSIVTRVYVKDEDAPTDPGFDQPVPDTTKNK